MFAAASKSLDMNIASGRPGVGEPALLFVTQRLSGQGVQNLFLFAEVTTGNRQCLMHGIHRFPDVSRVFDAFKSGPDLIVFGIHFGNQFVVRQVGYEGGEKHFFLERCVRVQLGRQGHCGTFDLRQLPSRFGQIFDRVEKCVEGAMLAQKCVDQFHGYSSKPYLPEAFVHRLS